MTKKEQLQIAIERTKSFLFNRQKAYQEVFKPESQMAKIIMEDLAKFCKANETCFHIDPRAHAVAEGRREVWLRIRKHLDLDSEQLLDYYLRKDIQE
jgi:hypothetical protein